jgi:uncharacterized protein YndB with AHSA1/START domain
MISEADYQPLRELMSRELPETHEEWVGKDGQQRSRWVELGHEVEYVDVAPSEFLEFCWDRGWPPNLLALDRFVWDKRGRHPAEGR